jgi:hypothetical protein
MTAEMVKLHKTCQEIHNISGKPRELIEYIEIGHICLDRENKVRRLRHV